MWGQMRVSLGSIIFLPTQNSRETNGVDPSETETAVKAEQEAIIFEVITRD